MRQVPSTMVEVATTMSQGKIGPGRPTTRPSKKTKKRADSKAHHGSKSRISPQRESPATSQRLISGSGMYSFGKQQTQLEDQICLQPQPHQPFDMEKVENRQNTNDSNNGSNLNFYPESQDGPTWQNSMLSYPYHTATPTQYFEGNDAIPYQNGFYLHVANNIGEPWTKVVTTDGHINADMNGMAEMGLPFGTYENLGSLSGSTPTSPESDGWILCPPPVVCTLDSEPMNPAFCDPYFSDPYIFGPQYYTPITAQPDSGVIYHDAFAFPTLGEAPLDVTFSGPELQTNRLSASNHIRHLEYQAEALEAPKAMPQVDTSFSRESSSNIHAKAEMTPATPPIDSDNDSFIPFDPRLHTPMSDSPTSSRSGGSHRASPRLLDIDHHAHVFSSFSGITRPKIQKGRQRGLTQEEKKQAREVRESKACWACHISKTKCSPCSSGSPCEQCARLVGKRRFCKIGCFNDPIESLYVFMVPDYLFGHYTRQDVEAFITRNTKSWGKSKFQVQVRWGYKQYIKADVVALELQNENSEMAYHAPVRLNGSGGRTLLKERSVPLGVPLGDMDDMEEMYADYVRDIAQKGLNLYHRAAYFEEDSAMVKKLFKIASSFYTSGLETGTECEVLRQAIEMHVATSVLEKNLALDDVSADAVQYHLGYGYSEKAVARCVQRQIKLAFFLSQQKRINKILSEWGHMMWSIGNTAGNDNKWAVSFCVFLLMTLVMGKMRANGFYFCETNIQHRGADPASERQKLSELLKLSEEQVFIRCKEIFHTKFKTRKGGKEACNPIRDGLEAFRGRDVDDGIKSLTYSLQRVVREYGKEIRAHTTLSRDQVTRLGYTPYHDVGRLPCVFLDDFLDH